MEGGKFNVRKRKHSDSNGLAILSSFSLCCLEVIDGLHAKKEGEVIELELPIQKRRDKRSNVG